MPVTKRDIQDRFKGEVKQIGSKQLFVVTFQTYQLLISYMTIIGYRSEDSWLLTKAKYRQTTTRHINYFRYDRIHWLIGQEHLEELIEAAQCTK